MEPKFRPNVGNIKKHLMCSLCGGYFNEATTISRCLHSFCYLCIVRHLSSNNSCPTCGKLLHNKRPLSKLRHDKVLQRLVYKMIPGQFKTTDELDEDQLLHPTDEYFSISLERSSSKSLKVTDDFYESLFPVSADIHTAEPRYLFCAATIKLKILKKFLSFKIDLGSSFQIQLISSDELLDDEYSLLDVAYISNWSMVEPLKLEYLILDKDKVTDSFLAAINTPAATRTTRLVPKEPAITPDPAAPAVPSSFDSKKDRVLTVGLIINTIPSVPTASNEFKPLTLTSASDDPDKVKVIQSSSVKPLLSSKDDPAKLGLTLSVPVVPAKSTLSFEILASPATTTLSPVLKISLVPSAKKKKRGRKPKTSSTFDPPPVGSERKMTTRSLVSIQLKRRDRKEIGTNEETTTPSGGDRETTQKKRGRKRKSESAGDNKQKKKTTTTAKDDDGIKRRLLRCAIDTGSHLEIGRRAPPSVGGFPAAMKAEVMVNVGADRSSPAATSGGELWIEKYKSYLKTTSTSVLPRDELQSVVNWEPEEEDDCIGVQSGHSIYRRPDVAVKLDRQNAESKNGKLNDGRHRSHVTIGQGQSGDSCHRKLDNDVICLPVGGDANGEERLQEPKQAACRKRKSRANSKKKPTKTAGCEPAERSNRKSRSRNTIATPISEKISEKKRMRNGNSSTQKTTTIQTSKNRPEMCVDSSKSFPKLSTIAHKRRFPSITVTPSPVVFDTDIRALKDQLDWRFGGERLDERKGLRMISGKKSNLEDGRSPKVVSISTIPPTFVLAKEFPIRRTENKKKTVNPSGSFKFLVKEADRAQEVTDDCFTVSSTVADDEAEVSFVDSDKSPGGGTPPEVANPNSGSIDNNNLQSASSITLITTPKAHQSFDDGNKVKPLAIKTSCDVSSVQIVNKTETSVSPGVATCQDPGLKRKRLESVISSLKSVASVSVSCESQQQQLLRNSRKVKTPFFSGSSRTPSNLGRKPPLEEESTRADLNFVDVGSRSALHRFVMDETPLNLSAAAPAGTKGICQSIHHHLPSGFRPRHYPPAGALSSNPRAPPNLQVRYTGTHQNNERPPVNVSYRGYNGVQRARAPYRVSTCFGYNGSERFPSNASRFPHHSFPGTAALFQRLRFANNVRPNHCADGYNAPLELTTRKVT